MGYVTLYELSDIKRLRKMLGVTQAGLAKLSGVSQSLIAKIESGKVDPSYMKAKRIFEVLEHLQRREAIRVSEIMTKNVIYVNEESTVSEAIKVMKKKAISQMPVLRGGEVVGTISEKVLVQKISEGSEVSELLKKKVKEVMEEPLPTLSETASMDIAAKLLNYYPAVLITSRGEMVGIITRSDLFRVER